MMIKYTLSTPTFGKALMKQTTIWTILLTPTLLSIAVAQTPIKTPAVLAGHAVQPAKSFIQAPPDAPKSLHTSGKFTTAVRTDTLGVIMGKSATRPTGISLPFRGQPLQGYSGIQRMQDGSFWILTDNGAGSKANSPDFMLHLSNYDIDFKTGEFYKKKTIFLKDPNKIIPFHIINEATDSRYLTGADFDPESFQIIDDALWIGDEFGPYLIKADMNGTVLAIFESQLQGIPLISPDHHKMRTPATPKGTFAFNVRRSKGFEGMASYGKYPYPMLEGALWDINTDNNQNEDGTAYLNIMQFDTQQQAWTDKVWYYPLESPTHAIGDFNMIDANRALVIERDDGEGVVKYACKNGMNQSRCFNNLPKFKRVYLIKFDDSHVNDFVQKLGYVDLLDIKDPNKIAKKPLSGHVFEFPFFTIENVDVVDDTHIIVGNDNNLPFSSSRLPNVADDNEMILLSTPELLNLGK